MAQLRRLRDNIITAYSLSGCSSKEIQTLLRVEHGQSLSMRQIQRIRKSRGVQSIRDESPLNIVQAAIEEELKGPGALLGYRSMWYRLTYRYHLSVKRDTVMMLLALMDPVGTTQRKTRRLKRRIYRTKGPNFLWHCDGYDKLKPFGIAIHGCIDGYSRRIMWLNAASSNNNPRYIANFYVKCIQEIGGCPQILRTDAGTENCILAMIQPMLRHTHTDCFAQEKSHMYGRSTSNQRIEAWWCQLRQRHIEWWISFFKDLQMEGHFCSVFPHHIDAIRFAFGPLIQEELYKFVIEWNHHRIRHSTMAELPSGIPTVLYDFPALHGLEDLRCTIDHNILCEIEENYCDVPQLVCTEFKVLAESVMDHYRLHTPSNFKEGLDLFFVLVHVLDQHINYH